MLIIMQWVTAQLLCHAGMLKMVKMLMIYLNRALFMRPSAISDQLVASGYVTQDEAMGLGK